MNSINTMSTMQIIQLVWPLILIEVCLKLFSFYRLYKDEAKHLPKIAWFFIILCVSTFGPLIFLFLGREKA